MFVVLSVLVFSGIIMFLVSALVVIGRWLIRVEPCRIVVNGSSRKIETCAGERLLPVLAQNGIFLPSACGGGGSCGHCKCQVLEGGGSALATERGLLSREELRQHYRLACQVRVRDDMNIRVAEKAFHSGPFVCEVVSNNNVATFIKELVLAPAVGAFPAFRAGEYLQISVPEYDLNFRDFVIAQEHRLQWRQQGWLDVRAVNDEPVTRAYSIASYPGEQGGIRLNVRMALPPAGRKKRPPGRASAYLFSLKPGDQVMASGPYGEFLVQDSDREMVYIGGGVGMAPLRSHLGDMLYNRKTQRKISFWYGARSGKELFYDGEFRRLSLEHPCFRYEVALSAPLAEDNWPGATGFIHQVLYDRYLKNHCEPEECEYYLCGPAAMIDATVAMLDGLGVPPEMISCDNFG